jgi:hypothetical protein
VPVSAPSKARLTLVVATALACVAQRTAWAGGGAATDAYDGVRERAPVDVHALADLYFQLKEPRGGGPQLRAFDDRADVPAVNLLRVTLAHRPDWLGFRVDVGVGDMPDQFRASDPANTRYPELSRGLSYAEQAFVSAALPVGRGLAVDAGKFGTPVGLEDNETPQNWNYSRSLLYTFAEPTYHTGLRATYDLARDLAVSAFWLNGWNTNVAEGNGMRSFAVAATWDADASTQVVVDYAGGLERAPTQLSDPRLSYRHELDVYAVTFVRTWLSFAATVDYGHDARDDGASWWGVGGYMRCRFLPWLAGVVRAEHLHDADGFTTGTAQRLAEATLTAEATTQAGPVKLIGRLEYRRDQSDEPIFQGAGARPFTHQDTSTLGVMALF